MKKTVSILFFLCLTHLINYAQDNYASITVSDTLFINFENKYALNSLSIVPLSEKIYLNKKLLAAKDYRIDYRKLTFSLSDSLRFSLSDTLFVFYETVLLSLNKEYKRRSLVYKFDEHSRDTIRLLISEISPFTSESIFGTDIKRSGSIVRGFSVGTNKDFAVNSGLRLQMSGKLSENIEIVAALTDENTPIQPEGNTERLEELDKVFIEIRHPNAAGTFGDYDLTENSGEFGRINRKLQGLKVDASHNDSRLVFALASSRGKFNTNNFNGTEGNQGPYRLAGINNERDIVVIAGSEKVYIDGEQVKRGENNDYIIEYSNAEIYFTASKMITSATRISVDFEYTDRLYQRNFLGGGFSDKYLNSKIQVGLSFYRESDNKDSPIDISLNEDEKRILRNAGDNRYKAAVNGAILVKPDSNGIRKGTYASIDTSISNVNYTYYKYLPGDETAIYNVTFSYVGEGRGDYKKISIGNYEFTGIGRGGYMPVKFLPLPESKQLGQVLLKIEPIKKISLSFELAGSLDDRNTFSDFNDGDNFGYAANFRIALQPSRINLFNSEFGEIGLSYRERFIQKKFSGLERFNNIEFERDYNLSSASNQDENLREANFFFSPVEVLKVNSNYGYLKRGHEFSSNRFLNKIDLASPQSYSLNYVFDLVDSKNSLMNSGWLKQSAAGEYIYGHIKPGFEFFHEKKEDRNSNSDSLLNGSFLFLEAGPKFDLIQLFGFDFAAKYLLREESFPLNGVLAKQSSALTQNYSISYKGIKEVASTLSLILRKKEFTKQFTEQGFSDNETVLIRSQSRFNFINRAIDGDLFYEVSTQKSARQERVFFRVERGRGNYIYLGDLNNNGISDEEEFEHSIYDGDYILITQPTDELFPVIDLKLNTRWRLEFNRFLKGSGLIDKILGPVSTETSYRIEENSKESDIKHIYLLNLSKFLNDTSTIKGAQLIQQDIHIFKNADDFSLRLRFIERRNLNQFSGGTERGYFKERSLRVRLRLVEEINNQTEITSQTDNLSAAANSSRARLVQYNNISTDFSYRPIKNIELGFKFDVGRSQDNLPEKPTIIDVNSQLIRLTYSLASKGRIRIEGERNELQANNSNNRIPFEITRGNSIGKNYFWRVNFDYRIAANLQTTVAYNGRIQGVNPAIHSLTAEARAYF